MLASATRTTSLKGLALLLGLLGLLLVLLSPARARAASDPALVWRTIETPHFRIHYHTSIEEVAQHTANICENIHETMVEHVGWRPRDVTEVLLIDSTEVANGSATALPYNALRLLVTAPEDLSPLGDVDDWYLELLTHEYTHILHTDNIRGLPAIINAVLGKTFAPNQAQPRWILEGLAVYHESERTTAGRVKNSQWDMWMRTDVLEDNVRTIDQFSSTIRRWPQGNVWYLYGSYFQQWISDTYGEEALRKAARDYGSNIIPWGFNRSIRRATGSTYVDMYPEWVASMKKRYGEQAALVRAKGIRDGARLTHHGQIVRYPRWIPDNAWPEHKGNILYYRDDQHTRPGLWALPITRDGQGRVTSADERHEDQIARTSGEAYASFDPEGGVVFGSQQFYKNVFAYGDLERMPPGKKSPFGDQDGDRDVFTHSLRAADPDVSPDGRRVVFTLNGAGTRSIHIADIQPTDVTNVKPLVPTAFLEQAFTPRWSPDGTHVAYSVWKRGGYRDIRYVDVRDGSWEDIAVDRAVDGGPSFSHDGRFLYFHSDRTGIANVYAWEIATRRFFQVTNVLTGAYSPEPSPDGQTLLYVGYTKDGFDLFAMPIDQQRWTEAAPYVDSRGTPEEIPQKRWSSRPYTPWGTLWPRRYGISVNPGNWGQAVTITASGTDITGFHAVSLSSTTELEKPSPQGTLSYTYGRLPFDLTVSAFRTITPRTSFSVGSYQPVITQENAGFASTVGFTQPTPYDSRSFSISHSVSRIGADLPLPKAALDPYATPQIPYRGLLSNLHLGYAYTNAERYLWGVGNERGYLLTAGFDLTDPAIGSDFAGFAVNADVTAYYLMPWLKHHSLAVHVGGGTSGGTFPGRGAFYVGGFVDLPIVDTVRNFLIQGGLVLRGYPTAVVAGRSYALGNLEYRFPIVNVDRGLSTLPIFFNRLNGAVFVDYGSAFDTLDDAKFKTGTGLELWSDWTLGYIANFTFRLGYARGWASGGIDKMYFVAAVPY